VNPEPYQWKWTQISSGEYEVQGEHYYYRVKRNDVLKKWALGRRLHPGTPIQLIGLFDTYKAARERAEADGAAL
jgi:hypothetical protein